MKNSRLGKWRKLALKRRRCSAPKKPTSEKWSVVLGKKLRKYYLSTLKRIIKYTFKCRKQTSYTCRKQDSYTFKIAGPEFHAKYTLLASVQELFRHNFMEIHRSVGSIVLTHAGNIIPTLFACVGQQIRKLQCFP